MNNHIIGQPNLFPTHYYEEIYEGHKDNQESQRDEFKEKLNSFSCFRKDFQQIATELSEIIPLGLEKQDIIDLIFKHYRKIHIPLLLDAFLSTCPSFTLSPDDQLRRSKIEYKLCLKEFEKKIGKLRCFEEEERWEFELDLSEITSASLDPQDIVNFLFTNVKRSHIPAVLDAFLSTFPSFTLSTEDKTLRDSLVCVKKFKDQLKYFWFSGKDHEEVAQELLDSIPKHLTIQDVVQILFEECLYWTDQRTLILLEAILIIDPFALSPYDKIRKMIIEDKDHLLTNISLMAMLKEHELDEEKFITCCDLAYRLKHPYIYRVSQTVISPSDYTLNFLWVNLNPQDRTQDRAQNIFNDGLDLTENDERLKDPKVLRTLEETESSLQEKDLESWKQIKRSYTYRLSKWADVHPKAQMYLSYDSALVTQKAQQKTSEMMKAISQSRNVNLALRDTCKLPAINQEIKNSLHPSTNVFYRVDMLKALIADNLISSPEEKAKYCVITDIDVEAMTLQQLFDQRTLDFLESDGYVFNCVGKNNFENNFFIFNREKVNLQKNHNKTIIKMTASIISSLRSHPINASYNDKYALGAQSVFSRYDDFRKKMGEKENRLPRKVVVCPSSQFDYGGFFSKSDYRAEIFRFIGTSDIPYTRNGRSYSWDGEEKQIQELIDWKAKPLD